MGKIEALITSQDKDVRAATVRTSSGKLLNRTLNFLYPFKSSELSGDKPNPEETNDQKESNQGNREETANKRPIRQAAIESRKTLHKLLNK